MKTTITNILNQYDFISFALLFGSYANKKANELSDIDIAIYISKDIDIFTQGTIIATLEIELSKKIDLVILNELYKSNAKICFNILNNHKLLFCKDKKNYLSFKENTLKYYFDISYMYDMFDNSLKKRLVDGTYGKTKAS